MNKFEILTEFENGFESSNFPSGVLIDNKEIYLFGGYRKGERIDT